MIMSYWHNYIIMPFLGQCILSYVLLLAMNSWNSHWINSACPCLRIPLVIKHWHVIVNFLSTDEVISGGDVEINLTYEGIVPFKTKSKLCDLTKKVNYPCPLPKGVVHVSVPTKIPKEAPTVLLSYWPYNRDLCMYSQYYSCWPYRTCIAGNFRGQNICTCSSAIYI